MILSCRAQFHGKCQFDVVSFGVVSCLEFKHLGISWGYYRNQVMWHTLVCLRVSKWNKTQLAVPKHSNFQCMQWRPAVYGCTTVYQERSDCPEICLANISAVCSYNLCVPISVDWTSQVINYELISLLHREIQYLHINIMSNRNRKSCCRSQCVNVNVFWAVTTWGAVCAHRVFKSATFT